MKRTPLTVVLLITFVDLVGFGLIIPLLPVYAERLNATGLTLGLLVGAYSFAQFIFNPVLGRLSDRIGRKPVLVISIGGSVLSHSLLGVADLMHSLPLLFLARTLDGITGANIATAQACIADVTSPERRARGMGLFGAAFGLGFVLGPAIGAGLYKLGDTLGFGTAASSWPAFGAATIALVALVLVITVLPESRQKADGHAPPGRFTFSLAAFKAVKQQPRLLELIKLMFLCVFAFVLLEVTFSFLCIKRFDMDFGAIGLIFAYIGVIIVYVQGGLVGRLVKRYGEHRLIATGPFITAAGFLLVAAVPHVSATSMALLVLIIACIPVAGGNGLTSPCVTALISREAAAGEQGGTLGVAQSLSAFARFAAPPIGGLLFDLGASVPYVAGGVLLVVAGFYARAIRRRAAIEREHDDRPPDHDRTTTPDDALGVGDSA